MKQGISPGLRVPGLAGVPKGFVAIAAFVLLAAVGSSVASAGGHIYVDQNAVGG